MTLSTFLVIHRRAKKQCQTAKYMQGRYIANSCLLTVFQAVFANSFSLDDTLNVPADKYRAQLVCFFVESCQMPLIFINQSVALHIVITWHLSECRFLVIYIMQLRRVVHMLQALGLQENWQKAGFSHGDTCINHVGVCVSECVTPLL